MRLFNLFACGLMLCLTNLCAAQKHVVVPAQKLNTIKMDFNSMEKDYARVQNELKQLEQQKKKLLAMMNDFNEQQKNVMKGMQKLEENYDRMSPGNISQEQLLKATKQMQETQMSFNLQYLQLQNQMQQENRSYTAVSNIMKTKHDTVKNSISNIR
jgi:septal ring factor EnvC (AmiA/AmiB activator)